MATNEIHVGDVGTAFRATILDQTGAVVNISSASSMLMIFKKPDNTVLQRVAKFVNNGVDGQLQYVTTADDLTIPGAYLVQGKVVLGGGAWSSDIHKFQVYRNIV